MPRAEIWGISALGARPLQSNNPCIIDIDCRLRISLSYHIASIRLGIAALLALHLTSSPAPIEYASYDRQ